MPTTRRLCQLAVCRQSFLARCARRRFPATARCECDFALFGVLLTIFDSSYGTWLCTRRSDLSHAPCASGALPSRRVCGRTSSISIPKRRLSSSRAPSQSSRTHLLCRYIIPIFPSVCLSANETIACPELDARPARRPATRLEIFGNP